MKIYKIGEVVNEPYSFDVDVVMVEPIWGKGLLAERYFTYIASNYNLTRELLTPGEVGCTLTHLSIYEKIVSDGVPAVILESDIPISVERLQQLQRVLSKRNFDLLFLGAHPSVDFYGKPAFGVGNFYELYNRSDLYGTYAYYISPQIAQKLLDFHSRILRRADSWCEFLQLNPFKVYYINIFPHPSQAERRSFVLHSRKAIIPIGLTRLVIKKFFAKIERVFKKQFIVLFGEKIKN